MSLFGAMTTAIGGLSAQSRALGHISDNVANSQTVGFKRIDTNFVSLVTNSSQRLHSPGGVVARPDFAHTVQGAIEQVENRTALAIAGQGFFPVAQSNGEVNGLPTFDPRPFFTRAGDFALDRNGYLVNSAGYFLQGWGVDPTSRQIDRTGLQPIRVSQLVSNPVATSEITLAANLPANPREGETTFASSVAIYDALGQQRTLELVWTKAGMNNWRLDIAAPGSTLDPVGGAASIPGFNDQDISAYNIAATVQPVRQTQEVNIDTVTAGQTYSVVINGITLSYTATPVDTATTIRNQLISRINSESATLGVTAVVIDADTFELRAVTPGTPFTLGSLPSVMSLGATTANVPASYQTDGFIFTGTVGEVGDTFTISLSGITGGYPATRSWTYTTTGTEGSINAIANGLAALINADPDSPAVASVQGGILTLKAKPGVPIPSWTVDPPATTNGTIPPHIAVTFGAPGDSSRAGTITGLSAANVAGGTATVPANQLTGDRAYVDIVVNYGSGPQNVRVFLGTFGQADGVTQFAGTDYAVRSLEQNGVPQGSFSSLSIRETGDVVINYDNGQSRVINRIPVVTFNEPDKLERVDGQAFMRTIESGEARVLDPSRDGAGKLVVGSIERSNVDIAAEFSKLILAQRAYTANTRIVSASDEMLLDTINMKR